MLQNYYQGVSASLRLFLLSFSATIFLLITLGCDGTTEPSEPLRNRVYFEKNLSVEAGDKFAIKVFFENKGPIAAASIPLTYTGAYARCDSVSFIGSRAEQSLISDYSIDTVKYQILMWDIDSVDIKAGSGLFATLYFWAYGNAPEADLIIDSLHFPNAQIGYSDTTIAAYVIVPEFVRGKVHIRTQL